MRKKIIALLSASMMLISGSCFAKSVTVTGMGVTEDDARLDALRMAVEQGAGVMIDSNTWVQNAVVVEDNILSKSKGFITDYSVVNKYNDGENWNVILTAEVADNVDSKLMSELTRLGIIENALRNPRIAVIVPETHLRYRVPDPAGETAIIKKFIDSGFSNMVDISQKRFELNNPFNMNSDELAALSQSLSADILIVGEAFSESVGDVGRYLPGHKNSGVQSCRARVEAKMYYSRTGQIIATDGKVGNGVDISEAIASKKALEKAGASLGEYFVDKLIAMGSGMKQELTLTVQAAGFTEANKVKAALSTIPNVRNVVMVDYSNGTANFRISYPGSPHSLFTALQQRAECRVELRSANNNTLIISAY